MDPMESIKQTFFQECEDLLLELEEGLLALNEGAGDDDTVNAVFRAVHSIKGGAGAFGFDNLVEFAHTFETTLDEVRAGRLAAEGECLSVLLRSSDILADLVVEARDGAPADQSARDEVIARLRHYVGEDAGAPATSASSAPVDADDDIDFQPMTLDLDDFDEAGDSEDGAAGFEIKFRARPELYVHANEPALLFRALSDLGDIDVTMDASDLPPLDEMDAQGGYLAWTIQLITDETEDAVREVFEFVDGDCELNIRALDDSETNAGIDDVAPSAAVEDSVTEPASAPVELTAEPVVDVEDEISAPVEAAAAVAAAAPSRENAARGGSAVQATVRVDLDRVDRLINLVGELVINQAMISQNVIEAGMAGNSTLAIGLEEFGQLTREIQESVMAIRAQPVKPLFQRMSRIVREAAAATGKSVRLKTEGEMTEVDKTVIERLADPLTHMIRNAVDHGLEGPEKRVESGKSEEGTVRLIAAHRSGRVIIEVIDDGAGINRDRVRQIAVDKGLIDPEARLTDFETDNLIFLPGFSTASTISNLSGRGVGMDVVRRAIQSLGGRISITSRPGEGSTFSISLPLTLAVLDGMVVRVDDQTLVVPLTSIVETLKPEEQDLHQLGDGGLVIAKRGAFIPVVDVGQLLGFRSTPIDPSNGVILSVMTDDGAPAAFLVDAIQDQRQCVIKSLEANYGRVPGVAAATILGDGRIALILDTDAVVSLNAPSDEPLLAAVG